MNNPSDALELYVLDALTNDIEDLESILRMLNSNSALGWTHAWGRTFTASEVIDALRRLVASKQVRILVLEEEGTHLVECLQEYLESADYGDLYFEITEAGVLRHSEWNPILPPE